ncbi:hypothetical protein Caci_3876 [Catenulispora acidiphila DSM 44928]|uniref:Uncharacterized protein n=1 Tax=Catenulispora acidiphila (strain DSM 44928 / JCM 14897 / NBRC 102108 / NRRL B-24433 / ID139908) TaxID=479433 RepID=C7QDH2_CATAD|nr:hypothetical protein Caci_3876 [Catenulispora acidiphila DSM 44928]
MNAAPASRLSMLRRACGQSGAEFAAGAPWAVFETQRRAALANAVKRSVQTASRLTTVLGRPWTPPEPGTLRDHYAAIGIAIAELRVAEGHIQTLIASQALVRDVEAT